jgi:hypothetical protein
MFGKIAEDLPAGRPIKECGVKFPNGVEADRASGEPRPAGRQPIGGNRADFGSGGQGEVQVMRRHVLPALLGAVLLVNSGCMLNIWSGDPVRRTREMMNVSEDLRVIQDEWERIWFIDQPSHLTPQRVHGGIE